MRFLLVLGFIMLSLNCDDSNPSQTSANNKKSDVTRITSISKNFEGKYYYRSPTDNKVDHDVGIGIYKHGDLYNVYYNNAGAHGYSFREVSIECEGKICNFSFKDLGQKLFSLEEVSDGEYKLIYVDSEYSENMDVGDFFTKNYTAPDGLGFPDDE